jgi:hypothetical protein
MSSPPFVSSQLLLLSLGPYHISSPHSIAYNHISSTLEMDDDDDDDDEFPTHSTAPTSPMRGSSVTGDSPAAYNRSLSLSESLSLSQSQSHSRSSGHFESPQDKEARLRLLVSASYVPKEALLNPRPLGTECMFVLMC